MEVKISKELYELNKAMFDAQPFDLKEEASRRYRWDNGGMPLQLAPFGKAVLEKFRDAIAKPESLAIRGSKTLHRDICTWLRLAEKDGIKSAKARSLKQAYSLMRAYLQKASRHHLYFRLQEGNEGVVLSYFVDKLEWHTSRDETPYFTVGLVYHEFGVRQRTAIFFHANDCVGMSAPQALLEKGYFVEDPGLRGDYEFYLEQYHEIKDQIGQQYLAVGVADDRGIDGNDEDGHRRSWWQSSASTRLRLDKDGEPSKVVIDVFKENQIETQSRDCSYSCYYWASDQNAILSESDENAEDDDINTDDANAPEETISAIEIPTHPYVAAFDLKRHKRIRIHVGNLTKYEYDKGIRDSLILPETHARLIDTLLDSAVQFKDVLVGKAGGTIILCQGVPGTGKTLSAEIYAESLERPLYTVQCSQLGIQTDDLESNLLKVLSRGRRWNAVMLLDEADVYVQHRGSDLVQNAIVGVFLRVLEYHAGVLFLTTNRGDLVDDAILSRCVARIPFDVPSVEDQAKIWKVLTRANGVELNDEEIAAIVERFPRLSGRDIKNLLKLAMMSCRPDRPRIDADLIGEVKRFKPTADDFDKKG